MTWLMFHISIDCVCHICSTFNSFQISLYRTIACIWWHFARLSGINDDVSCTCASLQGNYQQDIYFLLRKGAFFQFVNNILNILNYNYFLVGNIFFKPSYFIYLLLWLPISLLCNLHSSQREIQCFYPYWILQNVGSLWSFRSWIIIFTNWLYHSFVQGY
jgi:hypothetical protein